MSNSNRGGSSSGSSKPERRPDPTPTPGQIVSNPMGGVNQKSDAAAKFDRAQRQKDKNKR